MIIVQAYRCAGEALKLCCLASPLSNWALEIATALCVIRTEDANVLWALFPSASEEANENLIMDRILMSSKKTRLHEDVLQIIFLRLDPILPLPRVLYHVLGVVPAYQASIGPSLNELCLGLSAAEVAPALFGVYAKYVHVRVACLNAVKCVPALAGHSIPEIIEVATSIWLAFHVLTDTHPKVQSAGQTALQQLNKTTSSILPSSCSPALLTCRLASFAWSVLVDVSLSAGKTPYAGEDHVQSGVSTVTGFAGESLKPTPSFEDDYFMLFPLEIFSLVSGNIFELAFRTMFLKLELQGVKKTSYPCFRLEPVCTPGPLQKSLLLDTPLLWAV
nr:eIF-2-alpha kinase activator GCN1 isoform X17 [Ipomoea batatas]